MKRLSTFKIGLFVLVCVTIGLGLLIWVGAFFQKGKTYLSFFDESVGGLNRGANISYRGVPVGKVIDVGLAPDNRLVQVKLQINPGFRVDHIMAVQLQMAGIMGQRYLSIDRAPPNIAEITPHIPFPVSMPVIPSKPGEVKQIEQTLQHVLAKLEQTDLKAVASQWEKAGKQLQEMVARGEIRQTLADVRASSENVRRLTADISDPHLRSRLKAGITDFAGAAADAREATGMVRNQLAGLPPHVIASISDKANRMMTAGENAASSIDRRTADSLMLLQESVFQLNALLAELHGVAREFREEPGSILVRPRQNDPFPR